MNLLFARKTPIRSRLIIALFISIALMLFDRFSQPAAQVRIFLESIVSPVYYLANSPQKMLSSISVYLATQQSLQADNQQLKQRLLQQSEKLQRFYVLESENEKLRALLSSPVQQESRKLIAEVMSIDSEAYRHTIVVNRGLVDGVNIGHTVLAEQGIVGQVISTGSTTSRVMLITDSSHAVPVRVSRNNLNTTIEGIGQVDQLKVSYLAHSADIKVGDILRTSGLGGRFQVGYPVAQVLDIDRNPALPFAKVTAQPLALLDRIRYLLIILRSTQTNEDNTHS